MENPQTLGADRANRSLVLARVFDASPSFVFHAWTRPSHLVHWWGPRDFTTTSCALDVRPGGAYRICIRSLDGADYCMHGVYQETVDPARLVFTFAWDDETGTPSAETLVTVTFEEIEGGTRLTFHQENFASVAERDAHREGWNQSLDRLGEYLEEA